MDPTTLLNDPGSEILGLEEAGPDLARRYRSSSRSLRDQVGLVLDACRDSLARQRGGPFAAAVFHLSSGELVAGSVNLVLSSGVPVFHAELLALSFACLRSGEPDLTGYRLVTSADPCALCVGAIHWSRVGEVITSAATSDVEAIGFDEGPRARTWAKALRERGIEVRRGLQRKEAARLLADYAEANGRLYGRNHSEPSAEPKGRIGS
ncbi:MAG: nucleoside deaminase [Phycisphaerales bacterium JB038]